MLLSTPHEATVLRRPRPKPTSNHRLPDLVALEAGSHRPEVQRVIAEWIRRGVIRVVPIPGCENQVRIMMNSGVPSSRL